MLFQRVITAAILAPLVILAVFKLPVDYFALLFGFIILAAAWEWCRLIGIDEKSKKIIFFLSLLIPMLWIHFWTQFLEALQYLIETGQQDIYQAAKKSGWISISGFMEYLMSRPEFNHTGTKMIDPPRPKAPPTNPATNPEIIEFHIFC